MKAWRRRERRMVALAVGLTALGSGALVACGDGPPPLASALPGRIITVVPHPGMEFVRSLRVGPDGSIYVGGTGGVTVFPVKGDSNDLYSPADSFEGVSGLAVAGGTVYFTNGHDNTVKAVRANGGITNVAGNGDVGIPARGMPAAYEPLACPGALAYDPAKHVLHIQDGLATWLIGSNGVLEWARPYQVTVQSLCEKRSRGTGFDNDGTYWFANATDVIKVGREYDFYPKPGPDGRLRPEFTEIEDLAYDARAKALYVADKNVVKRIDTAGKITVVAGNGEEKASGDGGPPLEAGLGKITAIDVDSRGNLYIAAYSPTSRTSVRVVGAAIDGGGR